MFLKFSHWSTYLCKTSQHDLITSVQSVSGITVLCHVCKNDLMPVIICKNDKHTITLYNLSCHIWVISSINTRGLQSATEMKCIGKPICLTKQIHKLLFLNTFGQSGIDQNVKLVNQLMTGIRSFLQKWHNTFIPPADNLQ